MRLQTVRRHLRRAENSLRSARRSSEPERIAALFAAVDDLSAAIEDITELLEKRSASHFTTVEIDSEQVADAVMQELERRISTSMIEAEHGR